MSDLGGYLKGHDKDVKNLRKMEESEVLLHEQRVMRQCVGGPKHAISAVKPRISVKFGCSKSTNPESRDSGVPNCRDAKCQLCKDAKWMASKNAT